MTSHEMNSLSDVSLEDRVGLTSGLDFWRTKSAGRVPSLLLTDGPHGLRLQRAASDHLGLADSVRATCFPPAVGLGASFDPGLVERVADAIGAEAVAEDVAVVLGPGINIKRSPLCGRNFEYFSEDPIVSGVIGAAWVRGVQGRGVGASLKHFAVNNQETDRLRVSSNVDPRPLREIYLRGFQRVVEDSGPWTVMCSYNRINGVYASEDPWLLTAVLRDEWGFDGVVVSDWGAVDDRVAALVAGLDLEMPANGGRSDQKVVAAVRAGDLDERVVDTAVERMALLASRTTERSEATPVDIDAHHALAREAAARSVVLLKNDDDVLPLDQNHRVAVIGAFAQSPRYQGAGSSLINPSRLDNALDEIRAISAAEITFAEGFATTTAGQLTEGAQLRDEAVTAAKSATTVVVFLGLPAEEESEGFDRAHIDLPRPQLDLLDAVLAANPRTVVVLSHGGVVALPFADRVPAILDGSLLGQAGGGGTADVLYGIVNPSARLTETVPVRIEDTAAFGNFPGEGGHVRYGEGLLVGYRWYDARDLAVTYPFGHGLSYTTFTYDQPRANALSSGDIEVAVRITNTGSRPGREVVQAYVALPGSAVQRPPRELKAFASIFLEPNESGEVTLVVRRADLAYWHAPADRWIVESGEYCIDLGASSRDIRSSTSFPVDGDVVRVAITRESSIAEASADPIIGPRLRQLFASQEATRALLDDEDDIAMLLASFPVGRMGMFGLTGEQIGGVLDSADPTDR